eukprot:1448131-Amphidinium_carterae.1
MVTSWCLLLMHLRVAIEIKISPTAKPESEFHVNSHDSPISDSAHDRRESLCLQGLLGRITDVGLYT